MRLLTLLNTCLSQRVPQQMGAFLGRLVNHLHFLSFKPPEDKVARNHSQTTRIPRANHLCFRALSLLLLEDKVAHNPSQTTGNPRRVIHPHLRALSLLLQEDKVARNRSQTTRVPRANHLRFRALSLLLPEAKEAHNRMDSPMDFLDSLMDSPIDNDLSTRQMVILAVYLIKIKYGDKQFCHFYNIFLKFHITML